MRGRERAEENDKLGGMRIKKKLEKQVKTG